MLNSAAGCVAKAGVRAPRNLGIVAQVNPDKGRAVDLATEKPNLPLQASAIFDHPA
ncbi:hypothetical protein [Chamaesiphon sp. OTE_20_metabat_361]|uniref:hypothetical protein n=1 Tax=Chamaesiphon sp. OTE_20_metabat_361 TaxID=2964689 RepID=UPI00286A0E9B|nr:hypothetical protein [Chamaesiphon sp. OTE_20_metabat_361]